MAFYSQLDRMVTNDPINGITVSNAAPKPSGRDLAAKKPKPRPKPGAMNAPLAGPEDDLPAIDGAMPIMDVPSYPMTSQPAPRVTANDLGAPSGGNIVPMAPNRYPPMTGQSLSANPAINRVTLFKGAR